MMSLLDESLAKLPADSPAPGARMFHGDGVEMLVRLPTASVDLIATYPPYYLSNGGSTNSGGERVAVSKGAWDRSAGLRTDHELQRTWLRACQRVLRPEGTIWIFGTHHCLFSIGYAMQLAGWNVLNVVTWEKPNPPPNLGCRQLTHSAEAIIWASPNHHRPMRHVYNYDEAKAVDGVQMKDVWRGPAPAADEKASGRHPAMKPQWLMRRIVELASNPGDLVLDPFAGSGSTGVAALALDRRFVGAEQDRAHFDLAIRRLAAAARS